MPHTPPSHQKRTRKLLPVPVVALIDVAVAGACLCIFSLFHHVLPRVSDFQGTPISRPPVSDSTGRLLVPGFFRFRAAAFPRRLGRQMAG